MDFWRFWVFHDPNWDFHTFDFDRDVAYAGSKLSFLTANDPDLTRFEQRGGRLLMYQGWADPVVPATDTIRYYESVEQAMGGTEKTTGFVRLFLAPGMGHGSGGPGPSGFDALDALDRWVSRGSVCPYPRVAKWDGSNSIDDAAAFRCASAEQR